MKKLHRWLEADAYLGKTFGRLTVIPGIQKRYCDYPSGGQTRIFLNAICSCGNIKLIRIDGLLSGTTKSCGCLNKEIAAEVGRASRTHGESSDNQLSAEYISYQSMKQRCLNLKNKNYSDYGGRGIEICKRWLDSFDEFLLDMGRKPQQDFSLDRIDTNGNYNKSNCRWTDRFTQCNNQRSNRILAFDGVSLTLANWASATGISQAAIKYRLKCGWSLERTLNTVMQIRRNSQVKLPTAINAALAVMANHNKEAV